MPRSAPTRDSNSPDDGDRAVLVGSDALAEQLRSGPFTLHRWPVAAQDDRAAPPRVAIVDAGDRREAARDRVREIQRRWPLVDILVVDADASGPAVRTWLRSGVRDVLFDASRDALSRAIETTLDAQRMLPVVDELARQRVRSSRFEGMLSRSHAMWEVFEICARVAPSDANVLIFGETGTGKDLLARAIHRRSGRAGRFVAVNCSSLPEALIESELFGHERGAFTGAARARDGIFRAADGGTVFLDEVGDMPLATQQNLLRVLESRTIRPVGGTEEIPIDVRVVAATHVNLDKAVLEDRFREDLFYRLDVIRLVVPPLRERLEDVIFLFAHFAKRFARQYGVDPPRVQEAALERLTAYPWPGNVRELENFAERVVLRRKRALSPRDVDEWVRPMQAAPSDEAAAPAPDAEPETAPESESATQRASEATHDPASAIDTSLPMREAIEPVVERLERHYLRALLDECRGVIRDVAIRAGLSRRTLQRKMRSHGIRKEDFRSR